MKVPFLDLYSNYLGIKPEIDKAMGAVLADTAFIGGKYVAQFENQFAEFLDIPFCIGVGNGTDALEIAIESLDLPDDSEIIVPANTFVATAEAVTRTGHRVVFCDCDPKTYLLSLSDAEARITDKTSAIIPVHLYGQPCDMELVLKLANSYNLKVIEDCAQAHAAEFNGRRVGTFGDVAAFSFFPGKNLGAFGDAGAIVTKNAAIAKKCRMIANHGRVAKYDHEFAGRNSRLDGLQAAVLSVKLRHLDDWTAVRRTKAALYRNILTDCGVDLPEESEYCRHVYHLFVIQLDRRDYVRAELSKAGIETGVHYPVVLPLLQAYSYLGHGQSDFPVAYAASQRILSLPIFPELEEEAIRHICRHLISLTELP